MSGRRHSWVKLERHRYICQVCGCGRVNALEGGRWLTTFHLPSGQSVRTKQRPACVVGPRTWDYLERHAAAIACWAGEKAAAAADKAAP
jgi:hypothetical protein